MMKRAAPSAPPVFLALDSGRAPVYLFHMKITQTLYIAAALLIGGCGSLDHDFRAIHTRATVVDMHSDTVLRMLNGFDIAARDSTGDMDLPRLVEGGVDLQVFACWLATETPPESCVVRVDRMIDSLDAQIGRNSGRIGYCHSAAEAEQQIDGGRIAAFIGIENGVAIADDTCALQHFYDRGVRYMTLTHTASSDWCISSADTAPAFDGLTPFGEEIVRMMNRMGMIIDISHAHPKAVEKVLAISTDPVIASHSCVRALCDHDRNLTDDQIKAVAANGGVIGINYFSAYLSDQYNRVSDSLWQIHRPVFDSIRTKYADNDSLMRAERRRMYYVVSAAIDSLVPLDVGTVVDHIDHIVKLVGVDYVGLGSDFDGVPSMPVGLADCSELPNITAELVSRGYSEEEIDKILGGNFMRVFRQVCG